MFSMGLALLLFSQPACCQDVGCTSRNLPVSFRDSENLQLQEIATTDLEARIHGKPVKVLSIAPDLRPHRLVLALDTSGSMGKEGGESPLWPLELSFARHFHETNREKSKIALISFNDQVNVLVDFSKGNAAVGDKLREIAEDNKYMQANIKGRTALRDAVFQGTQLFDRPNSADAIYVLTDGGDNASHHDIAALNRRLAVTSVRVFAILLYRSRTARNQTPEEISGPRELEEIVSKSGGEILTAAEPRGDRVGFSADPNGRLTAKQTLERLYQTILQNRLIDIELPHAIAKDEHWELKLTNDARRRRKNLHITYQDTLVSCRAEVFGSGRN